MVFCSVIFRQCLRLLAVLVWLAGAAAAQLSAVPEVGIPATSENLGPPSRPPSRVLDQTGALTSTEKAALSQDLTAAAEAGLSLYFIALNSAEGLMEEDAATELARFWEDAPLTVVLLHVPGRPLAAGCAGSLLESLPAEEVNALTSAALAAGRARSSLPEQGKTAAQRFIADFHRYRAGENLAGPTGLGTTPTFVKQLMWWGGGAACVLLGLALLALRRRRARQPRLFPLTAPRLRFSAPHSGGNNASISFGKDDGSR